MAVFTFGDFVFDEAAYELRRTGKTLKVDPKVLDLLGFLLRRPGQLVTRKQIIDGVWEGRSLSESVLSGAMWSLRKVLRTSGRDDYVTTVYGKGYRLTVPVCVEDRPEDVAQGVVESAALGDHVGGLVGRERELSRALAQLSALQAGRGGVLAISGEPGIGKTRLAEALADAATSRGLSVVWSHCRSDSLAPPFWPLVQFMRARVQQADGPPQAVVELLAELSSAPSSVHADGDDAPGGGSHEMLDRIQQALSTLSDSKAPPVLIIDDAQWADAATLSVLNYLLPELPHMPLLIVLTLREEWGPALTSVIGHRNCEHVTLAALTARAVGEYVQLTLGRTSGEVFEAVFRRSEGNPFFMVELLRPFLGREALPEVAELEVSGPALDIVRARLVPLSQETRRCLAAAAVLGRQFDLGLLASLLDLPFERCMAALDEARALGIVRESNPAHGTTEFGHELFRGVLLETLASGERAALHLRAAETLEARHPVAGEVPRSELVEHWLSAVPLASADRAVSHALRLASQFVRMGSHEDAVAVLHQALSALNRDREEHPRLRCQVLLSLASSERYCARPAFMKHFESAVALARVHGYAEVLSMAGLRLSYAPGFTFHPDAHDILTAAADHLPPEAHSERAKVLAHLSWTPPSSLDGERAWALVRKAKELADKSGNVAAQVEVLAAQLQLLAGPDAPDEAEQVAELIERLVTPAETFSRQSWLAQTQFTRMTMALCAGNLPAAEAALSGYEAAARNMKHREVLFYAERAKLMMRYNRGDWDGLVASVEALSERARELRLFSYPAVRERDFATLSRLVDRPEVGRAPGADAQVLVGLAADGAVRKAYKIRQAVERGLTGAARAALAEQFPVDSLAALPHDRDYLTTLSHLCVVAEALGDRQLASALLPLLSPYAGLFVADIRLISEGAVHGALGLLQRTLGDRARATAHLESAIEDTGRAGLLSAQLLAMDTLAHHLAEGGAAERKRATGVAKALAERATALGLTRLQRRSDTLLTALGNPRGGRAS